MITGAAVAVTVLSKISVRALNKNKIEYTLIVSHLPIFPGVGGG